MCRLPSGGLLQEGKGVQAFFALAVLRGNGLMGQNEGVGLALLFGFKYAETEKAGKAVAGGLGGVVGVVDEVGGAVACGFFEVFVEQAACFGVGFPCDVLQGGALLVFL